MTLETGTCMQPLDPTLLKSPTSPVDREGVDNAAFELSPFENNEYNECDKAIRSTGSTRSSSGIFKRLGSITNSIENVLSMDRKRSKKYPTKSEEIQYDDQFMFVPDEEIGVYHLPSTEQNIVSVHSEPTPRRFRTITRSKKIVWRGNALKNKTTRPRFYFSSPSKSTKTQCSDVKASGSSDHLGKFSPSSLKTMVQVGGGDGVAHETSPPQSEQRHIAPQVIISGANTRTDIVPTRSPLVISSGVNNVVSTARISTVSALAKVSSVRIVPSPVATPTPSVISANSSQGARPIFSLTKKTSPTTPQATTSASTPNVDPPPAQPHKPPTEVPAEVTETSCRPPSGPSDVPRRADRQRRRERRERRRERRAQRNSNLPPLPSSQTEVSLEAPGTTVSSQVPTFQTHLPDLLNSHVPPAYSTLPNGGPRSSGPPLMGPPPPLPLHPPPPPPPGHMPPFPPPSPLRHRPDNPWSFFASRRSGGSRAMPPYLMEDEVKSCCGFMVTESVSIRWFIIMIAFVGLCCTVVGTVLGAVQTHSSEYITVTLILIGVGIILIAVSGVAWHMTSRNAPCRVMLGLSSAGARDGSRRFMQRIPPPFGRPQHPYAAMLYPEFQYRPPPPSYQASMQEYRLRLLLLDRQNGHAAPPPPPPPHQNLSPPPPNYRYGPYALRGPPPVGTLGRESEYSRPPSYRSREGSVTYQSSTAPSIHPSGAMDLPHSHAHTPSALSFLSSNASQNGSTRRHRDVTKVAIIEGESKFPPFDSLAPSTSKKEEDSNRVTIVQTTDSSQVIGSQSVIVTVSGTEMQNPDPGMSVLAHL